MSNQTPSASQIAHMSIDEIVAMAQAKTNKASTEYGQEFGHQH